MSCMTIVTSVFGWDSASNLSGVKRGAPFTLFVNTFNVLVVLYYVCSECAAIFAHHVVNQFRRDQVTR